MHEELFTLDELEQIIKEAQKPVYSQLNLLHLGSKKTSIIGVSKSNGLILVYGNEWTGYEHIIERHSLTSRKPYWNNNKLGNPTKFSLELAPVNYLHVASEIFRPENIDTANNTNPELFDVYIGAYKHTNEAEVKYKLIVYKGTKVIHTFFINDNRKPFNKEKKIDLRQGWVSANEDILNCVQTLEVPYYDHHDIERYKIIVRCLGIIKRERWYIQVNTDKGAPFSTFQIKDSEYLDDLPTPFRMIQIDFSNITWVEKIIKKMKNDDTLHG